MAWQLLAAALPAAAKVAGTALSKPKEEDFKPQTDYMKKYLSFLRGRTADREVAHMAMQPALRVAGRQGRQAQRQVGYDVTKAGLGGSGIEAQMRLSAGQQTQDALATATDKAVAAQTAETARIGEKAAGITAQIQAEEARADQAFKTAESNWKNQMTSDVIGGVASLASAGITQTGQLNEAKLMAERTGYFGSSEDIDKLIEQGWTPQMFEKETARTTGIVKEALKGGGNINDINAFYGINVSHSAANQVPLNLEPKPIEFKSAYEKGDNDMIDATDELLAEKTEKAKKVIDKVVTDSATIEEPKVETKVEPKVETKVETLPTIKDDQKNKIKQIRTSARINEDGSKSTVIMAQRDNIAFPTLFPKDPANQSSDPKDWIELEGDAAFEEAKKRGEVFEFGSESEAKAFAEGNWKDKQLTEEGEESKRLLKEARAKARSKIKSATSEEEEIAVTKEIDRYSRAKKLKLDFPDYSDIAPYTELTDEQDRQVRYYRDRGDIDEQIEARLGVKLRPEALDDVDLDKAVDALWALESDRGKDKAGLERVDANPSVTATGELQQNNAFYKDITTRMGYPEYDRKNVKEAKNAAKYYIEWVIENEGLSFEEAIKSYKAGITGQKRGGGMAYYNAFEKIYSGA